jgi:hypothetical protein
VNAAGEGVTATGGANRMLRAALRYASMGFSVFPCEPRGKEPRTRHGCKDATREPDQIRKWWTRCPESNVAIATGAISGMLVLDIDPRHGGDDSLATLEASFGKLPGTPTVLTGGGGLHIYFRHPGIEIPNSAGRISPGIDVRGDGGYVIAPPSVHDSGNLYHWEVSSRIDELTIADAPQGLLDLVLAPARNGNSAKGFEPTAEFKDGARNDFLYRSARSFHAKFKSTEAEILAMLDGFNESRCKPPVSGDELSKIARNAATQADRADFKASAVDPNVERLAKLSPLEYDQQRKAEAKKLGVRPTTLDAEVLKARPKNTSSERESLAPAAPEPWPDPVDGLALLNALRAFLVRFIVVGTHSIVALSLWIVFSYLLEVAETSPRLAITSPTKRCGKTLLLDLLARLAFRPIASSNLSPASIFRTIDMEQCSLLLDEADAMPRRSERAEEIRGLLNSGHTRTSAHAIRNVKSGDDWIPKKFSTWAAIAVAAIGELPDTWADRSIAIPMMRKPRKMIVERLIRRNKRAGADASELTQKIARWVMDHKETLKEATPNLPAELDDRACNNWELLLSIADAVAGPWPEMARKAAVELSGERGDSGSLGEQLIERLRALFEESKTDRLASSEICKFLATLEGDSWAEYGRAHKPITPNQLARLLKRFRVTPRTIRLGEETAKGYLLSDLEKVFAVYTASRIVTASHPNGASGFDDLETVTRKSGVTSDSSEFPNGENDCDGVTDQNAEIADREEF